MLRFSTCPGTPMRAKEQEGPRYHTTLKKGRMFISKIFLKGIPRGKVELHYHRKQEKKDKKIHVMSRPVSSSTLLPVLPDPPSLTGILVGRIQLLSTS